MLDASLPENLRKTSDVVEIVDESGRVLGVYTPILTHLPPPGFKFPISEEEWDRRKQEKTGRSLDEIVHDLKQKYGE